MENQPQKIIGIVLTVMGGLALFAGLILGLVFLGAKLVMGTVAGHIETAIDEMGSDAVKVTGEIVEVHLGGSPGASYGGNAYTIVGFYDEEDQYHEVEISAASSILEEGDKVTVYYDDTDPDNYAIPEIAESALGIVGSVFSVIGIVFLTASVLIGVVLLVIGIILIKKSKKLNMN